MTHKYCFFFFLQGKKGWTFILMYVIARSTLMVFVKAGYPTNQNFDYDALAPLLHFHINNAGDPFMGSSYGVNSTDFEISVLDWFAKLWEIKKGEYWGYVTTGGTEGNLHGILIG